MTDSAVEGFLNQTKFGANDALRDKDHVFLFFGAEWHTWTRTFLKPKLIKIYAELKTVKNMEIVFVSCDNSEQEFDRFTRDMPWPVVRYDQEEIRTGLTKLFVPEKNLGNPYFVVTKGFKVVNPNAIDRLTSHNEEGQGYPWVAKASEAVCMGCTSLVFCNIM